MGAGVLYTPDCRATYEELKAKGVQFKSEPKEQFYGIEALVTDGCGNWFSMTQPKEWGISNPSDRETFATAQALNLKSHYNN